MIKFRASLSPTEMPFVRVWQEVKQESLLNTLIENMMNLKLFLDLCIELTDMYNISLSNFRL